MLQCKKISNTCSECMFYSPWISSVIWSSVSCPALQHFPTSYGHVCPVQQYSTFPRFMVICVLPTSTTLFHVIWSLVSCPALQQFPRYMVICVLSSSKTFPLYMVICVLSSSKTFPLYMVIYVLSSSTTIFHVIS